MYTDLPVPERTHHPAKVLLDATDPAQRSQAFTDLGIRALHRQDEVTAEEHIRSAIALDPTDERPRAVLRRIQQSSGRTKRGFLGRLFGAK